MKEQHQHSVILKVITVLALLLLVLLVFQAGMAVGYRRGFFSYSKNMAYERPFDDPRSIFAPFVHDNDGLNPNSAVGEIVAVKLPMLMIKGAGMSEQIVNVSPTTTIRVLRGVASTSDITVGDQVIIIGQPGTDGRMDAAFIRILPPIRTAPSIQ